MKDIKKEFAEKCSQDIRDVLKKLVKFDDIEGVLIDIEGIYNVKKNDSTISPLDINYVFEYNKEVYRLRAVAINFDYNSGNKHAFPGVLQLHIDSDQEKLKYLDNIKKKSDKITINIENSKYSEYEEYISEAQPRENNMPIITGNGGDSSELKDSLNYWFLRGSLLNKGAFPLDILAGDNSDEVYKIAKDFLNENQIDYYFNDNKNNKGEKGKGVYNCKNFKWFLDAEKNKVILSPLTYNNGGIY